jgi:hypothetical protein
VGEAQEAQDQPATQDALQAQAQALSSACYSLQQQAAAECSTAGQALSRCSATMRQHQAARLQFAALHAALRERIAVAVTAGSCDCRNGPSHSSCDILVCHIRWSRTRHTSAINWPRRACRVFCSLSSVSSVSTACLRHFMPHEQCFGHCVMYCELVAAAGSSVTS